MTTRLAALNAAPGSLPPPRQPRSRRWAPLHGRRSEGWRIGAADVSLSSIVGSTRNEVG
jgi:hypothetical protein